MHSLYNASPVQLRSIFVHFVPCHLLEHQLLKQITMNFGYVVVIMKARQMMLAENETLK